MDWSGLQGVFTLSENDQPLIYVDQPGSSNIILTDNYASQMVGGGVFNLSSLQQAPDRLVFVDEYGNLHESYQDIGFLSQNFGLEDDGEIPSYALDHMYAKKPREPGTEQATKPRRRSRKKEQVVEHPEPFYPEPEPQTPKINIIRQRLPSSLYKSLSPSRPKILQGGSPMKGSLIKGGSQSPSFSSKKDVSARLNFSEKTIKKEDPNFTQTNFTPFGDDHSKTAVSKGLGFGNGAKLMKDSQLLAKSMKPYSSKVTSNSILMDDLHKQVGETEYEEEMLFDFGIAEDEDEVNRCDLSSEEFNDVVFGECEFGGGLEPYSMTTQSSTKGLSGSRLSSNISTARFYKKTGISTAATLSSGMSDDDDSNQIMVPMVNNRRKSRDWDSIEKVEADVKIHDVSHNPIEEKEIPVNETFKTENDISTEQVVTESSDPPDSLLISGDLSPPSSPYSPKYDNSSAAISTSAITVKSEADDCIAEPIKSKVRKTSSSSNSAKLPPFSKVTPEPTRRSVRAIRAPARLDDIDDGTSSKRRRR